MQYRPLYNQVLLQIIVPEKPMIQTEQTDTKSTENPRLTFKVMDFGADVDQIEKGDIVLLACTQADLYPLDEVHKLILVDKSKIACVVAPQVSGNN